MDKQQQSRWRPTRRTLLWAGSIVSVVALLLLIRLGYAYRWTGFGQYTVNGEVQPFKTLWDWLQLLIIPAVLAGGGLWFTRQQRAREQYFENQRAQDEALQAYLDQVSQLLTDKEQPLHKARPGDSLSAVARSRTLTVLAGLDGNRKGSVVKFLYEAALIHKNASIFLLHGADLAGVNLFGANLRGINLSGIKRKQSETTLARKFIVSQIAYDATHLSKANLDFVDLTGAELAVTSLQSATLVRANLSESNLSDANLRETIMHGVSLRGADLSNAWLEGADLSMADLSNAEGIDNEKLEQQAKSLELATMPNGQTYEDWLKSKGRGEDGENE